MSNSPRLSRSRLVLRLLGVSLLAPALWGVALLTLAQAAGLNASPTTAPATADLRLTKTVSDSQVAPGGLLTYTLAYQSIGRPAEGVRLTDTLPAGVTWVTDTASATGLSRVSTTPPVWTLPSLLTDTLGSLLVVVRVPLTATLGSQVVNAASISAATGDSEPGNNTAVAPPVTVTGADVRLSQSGPTQARRGAAASYSLTLTNTGNLTATGVVVTDSLSSHLAFQGASSGSVWNANTHQIFWHLPDLAPQASAALSLTAMLSAEAPLGLPLTNLAHVTANGDVDPSNNSARWDTLVYAPTATSGTLSYQGILVVGQPITVTATFQDSEGQPVPDDTPVSFNAPAPATLTSTGRTVGGQARATLRTTRSGSLVVTASAGAVNLSQTVSLAPGEPTQTRLSGATTSAVGQTVSLTAWVSDTYGNAVAPTPVQFNLAGVGQLGATSATTANGRAMTTLTSQISGEAYVTASAVGRAASYTVRFTPLDPARLHLDLYGAPVAGSPVALYATLRDTFSNTVQAGYPVRFRVVTGAASLTPTATLTTASGVASTTLQTSQAGTVVVRAESGSAADQESIHVAAGPPVRLEVSASPAGVGVDGGTTEITVRAVDQNGNVVTSRGGNVIFSFSSAITGTLSPAAPLLVNGVARATLTAPNLYSPEGIVLVASQADLASGRVTIPLLTPDVRVTVGTIPAVDPVSGYLTPGQVVTFTVNYGNSGQAAARNVQIEFTPPGRLAGINVTLPPGVTTTQSPGPAGGAWQWSVGTLAAGQNGQIQVRAQLDPAQRWFTNDRISADALIRTSSMERTPNASNLGLLDIQVLSANLSLTIRKPEDILVGTIPQPGDQIPYYILLGNAGRATVTQARITVTLPISTSFYQAYEYPANPNDTARYIRMLDPTTGQTTETCTSVCVWEYNGPSLGSVEANPQLRLRLTISPTARPGLNALQLGWVVGGPVYEAEPADNRGTAEVNLHGPNLVAQPNAYAVVPGDPITFTVGAFNSGVAQGVIQAIATNPTLTLTLPSQVQILASANPPTSTQQGNTLVWRLQGDYGPNTTANVSVRVMLPSQVPANTTLPYTLQVSAANPEPYLADNVAASTLRVIPDRPSQIHQADEALDLPAGDYATASAVVRDPNGNSVSNYPVEFSVSPPSTPPLFTLGSSRGATNATGEAATTILAGTRVGQANLLTLIRVGSQSYSDTRLVRVVPNTPFTGTISMSGTLAVGGETGLTAAFTDRYGNPVADGTVVTLTTNLGGFDVNGRLQTTTTARTTGGRVQQTFLAGTRTDEAPARVQACTGRACGFRPVTILPGVPARLTLALSRTEVEAGGEAVEVTVYIADQFGNPVANNTPVSLGLTGCPAATLQSAFVYTQQGLAATTLTPGARPCQGSLTMQVAALTQQAAFRVVPDAPQTLRLIAPATLLASGVHTGTVRIELLDRFANGINAPVSLSLTPSLGTLQPEVVQTVNGAGTAILTAPRRLGTTQLQAQAGGLTQAASVEFVPGAIYSIAVVPGQPVLSVDRQPQQGVVIAARDVYSNAVGGAISLSIDLGATVTPSQGTLSNGLFATTIRAGTLAGTAHLTATVAGLTRVFPIRVEAGAPTILIPQTSRNPARLAADGLDALTVTARVLDPFGNPVESGWPVSFTLASPLGYFSPPQVDTQRGVVTATLTAGTTLGMTQMIIQAGRPRITRGVEFVVGPPYRMDLALSTTQIHGTGEVTTTVALTATVQDRGGHIIPAGTAVTFETERGTFVGGGSTLAAVTDDQGQAFATLTTPPSPGSVQVTARAGNASGSASLRIGDQPYRIYLPAVYRSP
ncbi:MAG: Ig-like domain-containing protein [Anaerolineae bacterium]|nr:Ig-like domain-containing protein [Anaerolineae bacterium]